MTTTRTTSQSLYGRSLSPSRQREWFTNGDVPVAVYGLGKMGLPLATVYAETTGNTVGVDVDESVVKRINRAECPVENEPRLQYLVAETVQSGALRTTTDAVAAARDASVHVVIVPTTITDDSPDLSALRAVVGEIGSGLARGDLVIIESTVPPGTCRGVVQPLLVEESALTAGDFGLAFCPERTQSGRAIRDIRGAYPKVVGGVDGESTLAAELIYDELTENLVITVSDIMTAECVKLFEGVYRDVNIALANELARLVDELGVDVSEAIDAANTQPYCDIHTPGAGVGGHCIPYYPYFLMAQLETNTPLLETARSVNESMPRFVASKLLDGLLEAGVDPGEATVAVLGIAYRPGVQETRESPAFPIIHRLTEAGVTVVACDPIVDGPLEEDVRSNSIDRLPELDLDGAVLVTAHAEFDHIDWSALESLVIVDGRDALDLEDTNHVVYTIGRG